MAKNVITEVSVVEDGNMTTYAAECPSGAEEHQFLYELVQKIIQQSRAEPIIRIPNTLLAIDRRDVTSMTLSICVEQFGRFVTPIEDLAVAADIADKVLASNTRAITITEVGILTAGAAADVTDASTVIIAVKDADGNTIVTKTYDTDNQPPDTKYADLGTVSATHSILAANEIPTVSVTQGGATANMPAFDLIIQYTND